MNTHRMTTTTEHTHTRLFNARVASRQQIEAVLAAAVAYAATIPYLLGTLQVSLSTSGRSIRVRVGLPSKSRMPLRRFEDDAYEALWVPSALIYARPGPTGQRELRGRGLTPPQVAAELAESLCAFHSHLATEEQVVA